MIHASKKENTSSSLDRKDIVMWIASVTESNRFGLSPPGPELRIPCLYMVATKAASSA